MKRVFLGLSIILLLFVIYLITININNAADINIIYNAGNTHLDKSINTALYTTIILAAGLFVGAGTVYMFLDAIKDKLKIYRRELEKTAISGTSNASKVEVLEAKIKTLEKAFNTVIDERTKLEVQIKNLNAEIDSLNKDK